MPTIKLDEYAIHVEVVQERLTLSIIVIIRDTETGNVIDERTFSFNRSIDWTYSDEPEAHQ